MQDTKKRLTAGKDKEEIVSQQVEAQQYCISDLSNLNIGSNNSKQKIIGTAKSEQVPGANNTQSFGSSECNFQVLEDLALRQSKHSQSSQPSLLIGAGQNIEIEKLVLRAESLHANDDEKLEAYESISNTINIWMQEAIHASQEG